MGLLDRVEHRTTTSSEEEKRHLRGFLDKAASFRVNDPMEELCDERLSRVSVDGNAPYMALTILKAFFTYDAAFLATKNDIESYSIYSSFGLESSDAFDAHSDKVLLPNLQSGSFTVLTVANLGIPNLGEKKRAVIFPISVRPDGTAENVLVLLQRDIDETANKSIYRLLKKNSSKFFVSKSTPEKTDAPSEEAIAEEIRKAVDSRESNCELIILEFRAIAPTRIRNSVLPVILERIGDLGTAIALKGTRVLLILKAGTDRELYAYQITKTLKKTLSEKIDILVTGTTSVTTTQDAFDFLAELT